MHGGKSDPMSTYRLFKAPDGNIVRVKMGFSWQAFFVGSLKAIVRRTWLLGIVAVLFYLNSSYFTGAPTASSRTRTAARASSPQSPYTLRSIADLHSETEENCNCMRGHCSCHARRLAAGIASAGDIAVAF